MEQQLDATKRYRCLKAQEVPLWREAVPAWAQRLEAEGHIDAGHAEALIGAASLVRVGYCPLSGLLGPPYTTREQAANAKRIGSLIRAGAESNEQFTPAEKLLLEVLLYNYIAWAEAFIGAALAES